MDDAGSACGAAGAAEEVVAAAATSAALAAGNAAPMFVMSLVGVLTCSPFDPPPLLSALVGEVSGSFSSMASTPGEAADAAALVEAAWGRESWSDLGRCICASQNRCVSQTSSE